MANVSAKRYVCKVCGGEFIVTREGSGELFCCGRAMTIKDADLPERPEVKAAAQKGARYNCPACGTQVLCITPGNIPSCCGRPLEKQLMRIDAVSE